MSEEFKSKSIVQKLQGRIDHGVYLKGKINLAGGASRMWLAGVRGTLRQIYGDDATAVDFWCPDKSVGPHNISEQELIESRLPQLERLVRLLTVSPTATKIFIGHGRSSEWLKLNHFLSQILSLSCDEFNIVSTAGLHTANRIESMLTSARMAFLVMTAEDQHQDGKLHARENVIHEIGLFQAKLGPHRAIVMLEDGCSIFSNINGLTTINFPPNNIMAGSEEIRGALQRENLLDA